MAFVNEEIERALLCCSKGDCDNCPFHGEVEDCEVELPENALKLVNHYKREIQRLRDELFQMKCRASSFNQDI